MKNKHLTFNERMKIEKNLNNNMSFKKIGKELGRDCTTISKEIKGHIIYKNSGAVGRPFMDCVYRKDCPFRQKGIKCNIQMCEHYEKEKCSKLDKAPYVCNGCKNKARCTLSKQLYEAVYAQNEYKNNLKECREGITYTEEEINNLNEILKPLIKDQGQSIHHAIINNKNRIMCSEKEIYNLIDANILDIKNIDLPRKVRYRQRPKRKTYYKIDKECRLNRLYQDFLNYIKENPDTPIVEMDSVEGIKGGKVLLTIHFVNCSFQLAILRDHNDAQSVIDYFNYLEKLLSLETFKKLFPLILTDNGSEFSNPKAIEYSENNDNNDDDDKTKRTMIFYCDPERSDQKGSCENNHEFIRRILPQGTSLDDLTQEDINLMMSHINSYKRKKLNNCSPIQLFSLLYGNDILQKLKISEIDPNSINLTPSLLNKKINKK